MIYEGYNRKNGVVIHKLEDFEGMRRAGVLARQTLDYIAPFVVEGVSTEYIDGLCYDFMIKHNATPATLNYKGYTKSCCTSINHVVCHGIPSPLDILKKGDIINIDVTVILNGYFGDTSRMYFVGVPSTMAQRLCNVTYEAMMRGIDSAKPGNTLRDIGKAIEAVVSKNGYSCVKDFCGHGIGKVFHMEPQIMHFNEAKSAYQDLVIEEGMFFTIEPMANAGKSGTRILDDGWTAITKDKSLSSQYEHTIGITGTGNEVFTL